MPYHKSEWHFPIQSILLVPVLGVFPLTLLPGTSTIVWYSGNKITSGHRTFSGRFWSMAGRFNLKRTKCPVIWLSHWLVLASCASLCMQSCETQWHPDRKYQSCRRRARARSMLALHTVHARMSTIHVYVPCPRAVELAAFRVVFFFTFQ